MSGGTDILDDVFELLEIASQLEKKKETRIEAATKYYEAVYLMKRLLIRLPQTPPLDSTRDLLRDKISHYEALASRLLADAGGSTIVSGTGTSRGEKGQSPSGITTITSFVDDPRSPLAIEAMGGSFFHDPTNATSRGVQHGIPSSTPIPGTVHVKAKSIPSPTPPTVPHIPPSPPLPQPLPPQQQPVKTKSTESPRFISSAFVNEKAGQANTKLSYALDLDERQDHNNGAVIKVYMEAAELYLQALKGAQNVKKTQLVTDTTGSTAIENVESVLSRRLEQILDRVEQLKNPDSSRNAVVGNKIGEHNKHRQRQQPSFSPPPPVSSSSSAKTTMSALSVEEISVLKQSSLIASGFFLPWSDEDAQKLSLTARKHLLSVAKDPIINLYTDPNGDLPLSDKQFKHFHRWARPNEIISIRRQCLGKRTTIKTQPAIVINNISPYNIIQQGVTDCSFIASLCICAAFERRFKKRIITSILYPQTKHGTLMYNPQGKYMVKLWLNGVARQVVVDDRLPIDKYGNLLCAFSKCPKPEQLELWVCIIEKAYMKLCGGYNFPGSNSGVDLFSLTGWIPERILFAKDRNNVRDHETPPERCWERLFSASSYGDCLITMSSEAKLTDEEADAIGLYTAHAYAVLSVIQTANGTRLLQLKNPWAHKGWKGRFSGGDSKSWKDPTFCAEVGYNPKLASQQDDGVFWICWDDILKYFQNIHMSWNPALFQHRISTHGFWPKDQGPKDDTFNCGENPQYLMLLSELAVKKKATIWILVSRHVARQEQEGSEATDFLTLHLHRNMGKNDRIWYSGGKSCVLTGAYTNNPHCLVRYDVNDPADANLSLILSQYDKKHDLAYTLSCFCTEAFTLGHPVKELPFIQEVSGSWIKEKTAGGPIGTKTFYNNPMFAVSVPADRRSNNKKEKATVTIQLRCSTAKTLAVNVILVPVDKFGSRVNRVKAEPPIDSGNYRHGFIATERKNLLPGFYTMIVSSYSCDQPGYFNVMVCSSAKLKIDQII